MSIRGKVEGILNDITLKGEDADLKDYESQIAQYKKENLDELYVSYMTIFKENLNMPVKTLILNIWKIELCYQFDKTPQEYWTRLSKETRDLYKKELSTLTRSENDLSLREMLCEVIANVLITIDSHSNTNDEDDDDDDENKDKEPVATDAKEWPEFQGFLAELASSESEFDVSSALSIITICFQNDVGAAGLKRETVDFLGKKGNEHPSEKVQLDTIELIFALANYIDETYSKHFVKALPLVFEKLKLLVTSNPNHHKKAINILRRFADFPGSEIKKYFFNAFEIVKIMFNKEDITKISTNQLLIDLTIELMEANDSVWKKKHDFIEEVVRLIYSQVLLSIPDANAEWTHPYLGYGEGKNRTPHEVNQDAFLGSINQLGAIFPNAEKFPALLKKIVKDGLENNEWKAKYFFLMAEAQIGEYFEDESTAGKLVKSAFEYLNDSHPKVRFAAAHVFGKYCDGLASQLQNSEPELCDPLCKSIDTEEVPRLISHGFSTLSHFFSTDFEEETLSKIDWDGLIKLSLKHLNKGTSFVKEDVLGLLADLGGAGEDRLNNYAQDVIEAMLEIAHAKEKEHFLLRSNALEPLTNWLAYVPAAKTYEEKIGMTLVDYLEEDASSEKYPSSRTVFVLNPLRRLLMKTPEKFEKYITSLFPKFIDLAETCFQSCAKTEEGILSLALKEAKSKESNSLEEKDEEKEIEDSDLNLGAIGVDIMCRVLEIFPKQLAPYTSRFLEYFRTIIASQKNPNIPPSLYEGIANLLKIMESATSPEEFVKIYAEFIISSFPQLEYLVHEVQDGEKFELAIDTVKKMYAVQSNILKPEDVKTILDLNRKLVQLVLAEVKIQEEISKHSTDDADDDEAADEFEKDFERARQLLLSSAENLGEFLKYNDVVIKENFAAPFLELCQNTFWSPLPKETDKHLLLAAFYTTCDAFEFFSPDHPSVNGLIDSVLLPILELGVKAEWFACYQPASYAVGVFAKTAKKETFALYQSKLLEILSNLENKVRDSSKPKLFEKEIKGYTKKRNTFLSDNIGAAYGKMLKYQKETVNQEKVLGLWLNRMPVEGDTEEMQEQNELFADFVLDSKFDTLFGENHPKRLAITQKIKRTRELVDAIKDQGAKRKIEHAYLTLTKS